MFTLKKSATFRWPVEVKVPVDGGTYVKETFDIEFARLSQAEVAAISRKSEDAKIDDMTAARQLIVGWSGVVSDGEEVPFSNGALEHLLGIQGVGAAIVGAYYDAIRGALRKN